MMKVLLLLLLLNASDGDVNNSASSELQLLGLFLVCSGVAMEKICVKSGEIVALHCPKKDRGQGAKVTWKTPQTFMNQTGVLISDESIVLFNASVTQEGRYSCSHGKSNKTFDLAVYTSLSSDCESMLQYPMHCDSEQSCTLTCPTSNTPQTSANVFSRDVTWFKGGKMLSKDTLYFGSVKESDEGVYACMRSFLYNGQVYNMTFTVPLDVKSKEIIKNEGIIIPRPDDVFLVDVGSPLVINCTAVIFLEFDEVYWQIKDTSVGKNKSLRVHCDKSNDGEKKTASLIFKEVSKEDLSTVFTCKLESMFQATISVNITLSQKVLTSLVGITISTVVFTVLMISAVMIYIKYKIHITLFLRDTLGCHSRVSDGKSFDACVMYYKSETGAGLSEDDRKILEKVLEDQFGYSLCLFDRDVLPGKAVADAVLECVEQSRSVLLAPASPDLGSESALLSAIHEALVERQTRLVLIKNKSTEKTGLDSLSETLQLLTNLGHSVTWTGLLAPSSFFWKQLRYYLPPVQQPPKISLLPQTQTV